MEDRQYIHDFVAALPYCDTDEFLASGKLYAADR